MQIVQPALVATWIGHMAFTISLVEEENSKRHIVPNCLGPKVTHVTLTH